MFRKKPEVTSKAMATKAAKVLADDVSTELDKSLAGAVLTQAEGETQSISAHDAFMEAAGMARAWAANSGNYKFEHLADELEARAARSK